MKTAAIIVTSIAIGLAWPAGAQDSQKVRIGPWEVSAFFESGKFRSCVMARDESKDAIGGGFNRGPDFLVLALFSRDWKLDADATYPVRVTVGKATQEVQARARTGTAIGITLNPSRDFVDQLRQEATLEVVAGRSTIRFPLEQAGEALAKLEECYEEHTRRTSNPFASAAQASDSGPSPSRQSPSLNPFAAAGSLPVAECNRHAPHPTSFTTDDLLHLQADEKGIMACEAAVRERPSDPQRLYQLGRVYAAKGQTAGLSKDLGGAGNPVAAEEAYKRAREIFEAAAKNGSAVALYDLAQLFSTGQSVADDAAKALKLFEEAHVKGIAAATGELGHFYDTGKGPVAQDYARARAYYEMAAERGDSPAMGLLATLYKEGKGVPRDLEKAALWSRRSDDAAKQAEQRARALRASLGN